MNILSHTVGQASDAKPTQYSNNQLVITQEFIDRLERIESLCRQNKDTFTMKELAVYTGLSKQTLYKLTSKRKIPFYSPNGKILYFDKKEIDVWLKTNKTPTEDEISNQATVWANQNRRK